MPPCFNLLNNAYFNSVSSQAGAVQTPNELQSLVNTVYNDIALVNSTLSGQLALLQPLESLLTLNLANLADVISWLTTFTNSFLGPYLAPILKMQAQLVGIEAEMAQLTATIDRVAATKFPGFTVVYPPLAAFCSI
jgi:hypothetical protein